MKEKPNNNVKVSSWILLISTKILAKNWGKSERALEVGENSNIIQGEIAVLEDVSKN